MSAEPLHSAGRFRPVRFHARGGLGEVLLAEDAELGRPVALKRILPDKADSSEARARFVREAEITGRLEHPGVVPVYGLGRDAATGQPYYAMRFITGRSLRAVIEAFHAGGEGFDSLAFRKLIQHTISICQTVSFAHNRGVIHRDLKPSNVLVGEFGETLVVDWGLARPTEGSALAAFSARLEREFASAGEPIGSRELTATTLLDQRAEMVAAADRSGQSFPTSAVAQPPAESPSSRGSSATTIPLTQTGHQLGTPGYMSPEQAQGRQDLVTAASDVYGLGATLYHVLTGRGPLHGRDPAAMMYLTTTGQLPAPSQERPGVPATLEAVCGKAMALRPEDRYTAAADLAADLERWLADEPVSCQTESRAARLRRWARRNPVRLASGLAGVLAATVVAGLAVALLGLKNRELDAARRTAEANAETASRAQRSAEANAERAERNAAAARAAQADAEKNFRLARRAVAQCLDLGRHHPVFSRPGSERARELLLETAEPFHAEFARISGVPEPRLELLTNQLARAATQTALSAPAEARATFEAVQREAAELASRFPDERRFRELQCSAGLQLGRLHLQAGRLSEAESRLRAALAVAEPLHRSTPDAAPYRVLLAETQLSLAEVLLAMGRLDAVESAARAVTELLTPVDPGGARGVDALAARGRCHYVLGRLATARGQEPEALTEHLAALKLQDAVVKRAPTQTTWKIQLAETYATVSRLAEQEQPPRIAEAVALGDRAVTWFNDLAMQQGESQELRRRLAGEHSRMARLELQLGHFPSAERHGLASRNLWAQLSEAAPADRETLRALADAEHLLARLTWRAGDLIKAEAQLKAATRTRLRLTQGPSPDVGDLRAVCELYDDTAGLAAARGDAGIAETFRRLSVGGWTELLAREQNNRHSQAGLAEAQYNLGLLLSAVEGRRSEAVEPLRAALSLWEQLQRGTDPPQPDPTKMANATRLLKAAAAAPDSAPARPEK